MQNAKLILIILLYSMIVGCQTMRPIHTIESVDLKRFTGDWYVIASIPTFIEKDATMPWSPTVSMLTEPLPPRFGSTKDVWTDR